MLQFNEDKIVNRHLSSLQFMQDFSGKLESALQNLSIAQYPPDARREMRKFSSTEVAALLDVSEAYIRQVVQKDIGPTPEVTSNGAAFIRWNKSLNSE